MINKSLVSVNKLRFQRGYSYLSMFGIAFLVAREMERYAQQLGFNIPLVIFIGGGVFGIWLVGYLDIRLGFWGRELEYSYLKNPEWLKIKINGFTKSLKEAKALSGDNKENE